MYTIIYADTTGFPIALFLVLWEKSSKSVSFRLCGSLFHSLMPLNEKAVCAKVEPRLGSLQSLQHIDLLLLFICSEQNWTNVFRGGGAYYYTIILSKFNMLYFSRIRL